MKQRESRPRRGRSRSPAKTAESSNGGAPQDVANAPVAASRDVAWAQTLLEATSDGVLVVDGAGSIQFANRQVEVLFGWERRELIGQTVDLLFPPSFRQVHLEGWAETRRPLGPEFKGTGREFLGRRKDGADLTVEVSLSPFSTAAGAQVVYLITDTSGRIAAERRFDLLFRAFPVPTYVWQRQEDGFVLIDFNEADKSYTHGAVRRFLNRGLRFMFPEGGQVVDDIEQCFQQKSRLTREMLGYRTRTTDEVKDLVVTYVWAEPDLVLMVVDDVTAERAALEELKKLSSVVEQTADAVFITDRTGVIEYVNPAFEQITGFTRGQALGQNPRILQSGQTPREFYQRLWKTVLDNRPFQGQTVNRRRDGTLFTAVQTITPMTDQEGQITHLVSVLKDMTEQIRHHEQETELRLAGRVQKRLFPTQPPQIANYDIAGAVFPANATSGDFFDYVRMADNALGIVVADACGHGMGPALIMAQTRAYLRSITHYESDPRTVLAKLNLQLYPDLDDADYITTFLARLDPDRHQLDCANAGNWPAFILDAQGDVLHELRTDGTPIGLFPDLELRPTDPIPLAPGSMAVFTTDGIPEAFDVAHQEYGFERMLDVIRQHRAAPAAEIVERVREAVQAFAGPAEQADDQTLVICKRVG